MGFAPKTGWGQCTLASKALIKKYSGQGGKGNKETKDATKEKKEQAEKSGQAILSRAQLGVGRVKSFFQRL